MRCGELRRSYCSQEWPSARPRPRRQKRALELADYYRLEAVSDPQISPDGRQVAFVRSVIVESDNTRQSEVWLVPTDGSAPPPPV